MTSLVILTLSVVLGVLYSRVNKANALVKHLQGELIKPTGAASHDLTDILTVCQGTYNDDGVLVRGNLNREKLEKDLLNLLIRVKKLEFDLQDSSARVLAYKEALDAVRSTNG